jgi:hypothetical protein
MQAVRAIARILIGGHGALAYEINVTAAEYRVQCDCDLLPRGNLLSFCYTDRILEQKVFEVNAVALPLEQNGIRFQAFSVPADRMSMGKKGQLRSVNTN